MLTGNLTKGQRVQVGTAEDSPTFARVMFDTKAWDTFVWVSYENDVFPLAGFGECNVYSRRELRAASELARVQS
jgi:hypothetical protein